MLAVLGEQAPPGGMVLDGTVVALDEAGRPSRAPLLRRTATVSPDAALRTEVLEPLLADHRGRLFKTMGDGFLAMFDGPARGVRCAEAIAAAVRALGIEIRAGVHTGEVAIEGDDVVGLGVAIGARVGAKAGASEVLVSQIVNDLVAGSGLAFEDAGEHELKGVPDRWRLYKVVA